MFSRHRAILIALATPSLATFGLGYAALRPNAAYPPAPPSSLETWPAVSDGRHNSNTDLTWWHGAYWLVHASAPWHFASRRTRLVLRRSEDARSWPEVASFTVPGEDVRDPKFAVIGDQLRLYWLPNRHFPEPQPYTTFLSSSADGLHWTPAREMSPPGWLIWRPKTRDGLRFYATAYWHEHGEGALFASGDGETWEKVSTIAKGNNVDETDFEFLPDGRILATLRIEGASHDSWFGDPEGSTQISVAAPPYGEWTRVTDRSARLDGPCLFSWKSAIYAVGRYEPETRGPSFQTGSILSRKRTALYRVEPERLRLLAILPSAGDTAYGGVVLREGTLLASYYTSRIDRDYPWILGMLSPSDVRLARLDLPTLESLAP
jgi:hypothetical protein